MHNVVSAAVGFQYRLRLVLAQHLRHAPSLQHQLLVPIPWVHLGRVLLGHRRGGLLPGRVYLFPVTPLFPDGYLFPTMLLFPAVESESAPASVLDFVVFAILTIFVSTAVSATLTISASAGRFSLA